MIQLAGIFSWELIDSRTKKVRMSGSTRNLITDVAMNAMGSGTTLGALVDRIAVGTGSSAPAFNQTVLDAELARTTVTTAGDNTDGSGAGLLYYWRQRVWLFTEAFANGNLTEVGVFSGTPGTMFSRQLFKDGLGNPTVIPKTNTDQLKITYEYRFYVPQNDVVGNVLISGTNYAYTVRAENSSLGIVWGAGSGGALIKYGDTGGPHAIAGDVQTLGTVQNAPPTTQSSGPTSAVYSAYAAGSFVRDTTVIYDPGIANFTGGGIGDFRCPPAFLGAGLFQMSMNPKIPKVNTQRLTIVFRVSWGRYP
jgi:hypothetical protein